MKIRMEQDLSLLQDIGRYWDVRLTSNPENPFTLAPPDQKVDQKNYREQNKLFGGFCSRIMATEISNLDPKIGGIEILGAGLARDLGWIGTAVKRGFRVEVRDASAVACQNARKFLKRRHFTDKVGVTQLEVLSGWKAGKIRHEETVAYYASQFVEHLGDAMIDFMHHLGQFLRLPERRIYLVLARYEDNQTVKWTATEPPQDIEWQIPLKDEFDAPIEFRVLGKHVYFNRKYTFYRVNRVNEISA